MRSAPMHLNLFPAGKASAPALAPYLLPVGKKKRGKESAPNYHQREDGGNMKKTHSIA